MTSLSRFLVLLTALASTASGDDSPVRSAKGGRWSAPTTWETGRVPEAGDRVLIRAGHEVRFDARVESPIRSIHVAGTLDFDPDRDVLLTVGLIVIRAGEDLDESGLEPHGAMLEAGTGRGSLLVGTAARPISVAHSAIIRLAEVAGLDPETCPAILCEGGRMEFHGAEVKPTWAKLGKTADLGDSTVELDRAVEGWRVGDRVIVTSTRHQFDRNEDRTPRVRQAPQTEERIVRAIEGARLTLDAPLANRHAGDGLYRGEVALLSRNVVVESARPDGVRGHTMYHRDSVGSISFAEFRHLGKPGKLGKYSLHFHKAGDSMRGSSVVGASIWDSGNRWITVHATNRLVIRDCVGYRSEGHGFFLEDGTEVNNILDGNLAVQAIGGSPLPGQLLAYDRNDGAGFWWANSRNAFSRNVAVECDGYGFRLDAPTSEGSNPNLRVRDAEGRVTLSDIRTEPFLRFDGNEAHSQRRYGVNLGGPSDHDDTRQGDAVGPDSRHPLAIQGLKIWDCHWAFSPSTPGLVAEGLELAHSEYGFFRANFARQAYRGTKLYQCGKAYASLKSQPPDPTDFPRPLEPVDDRPPVSSITEAIVVGPGRLRVSGSAADDGPIKAVRVNGRDARALVPDFSRWELTLEPADVLTSTAEDAAGHLERTPHVLTLWTAPKPAESTPLGVGAPR